MVAVGAVGHTLAVFDLRGRADVDAAVADSFARTPPPHTTACPLCVAPSFFTSLSTCANYTALKTRPGFTDVLFVGRMVLATCTDFVALVAPVPPTRDTPTAPTAAAAHLANVLMVYTCAGHALSARNCAVLLARGLVVGGTADGRVVAWGLRTGAVVHTAQVASDPVASVIAADEAAGVVVATTQQGRWVACTIPVSAPT